MGGRVIYKGSFLYINLMDTFMFYIKGCILKSVDGVKLMALSEYGVRYIYTFFFLSIPGKIKEIFFFYKSMSCVFVPFIILYTFYPSYLSYISLSRNVYVKNHLKKVNDYTRNVVSLLRWWQYQVNCYGGVLTKLLIFIISECILINLQFICCHRFILYWNWNTFY